MMVVTYSEARQNLSEILNKSRTQSVIIARKDGTRFKIDSIGATPKKSPFDIESIISGITKDDILSTLTEVRER